MYSALFLSVTIAALSAGIALILGANSAHVMLIYVAAALATLGLAFVFRVLTDPRSSLADVLRGGQLFAPAPRRRRRAAQKKPFFSDDNRSAAFSRLPTEHYRAQLDLPRIVCVGCWRSAISGNLAEQLFRLGHAVDNCEHLELVISILTFDAPDRWRCLVVNMDGLLGERSLESIFETLIAFRKNVPNVPVLLVWRDLRRDELGTNRHVVADASLASPVSDTRLRDGLVAARRNNILWRNKRAEQFREALAEDVLPPA